MAHRVFDRVRDSSTTSGTGNLTMAGAFTGFRAMSAALTVNGDTGTFFISDASGAWEVSLCTRVSATVLARTTVYASSNAGALVSFSGATKEVTMDIPAYYAEFLNSQNTYVASAATCDIGAVQSSQITITGTTTISSFGTELNKIRFVHFEDVLTLTFSGSLVLPGSVNKVTAAGDTAIFISNEVGEWRCFNYQDA